MLGRTYRSFISEKYDLDVGLALHHFLWSIFVILDLSGALEFNSVSAEMIGTGKYFFLIVLSLLCACLHVANVFVIRMPFLRTGIYALSLCWGIMISLTLLFWYGLNAGTITYLTWFVIGASRKIFQIIETNYRDFHSERVAHESNGGVV